MTNINKDNLNIRSQFILISIFAIFLGCGIYNGIFDLVTTLNLVGEPKSEKAIVLKMSKFKRREFEMLGLNGLAYTVDPRISEFDGVNIGDTLTITFNSLNPHEAYLKNNHHIIYGNIFGLIPFLALSCFLYFRSKNIFLKIKHRRLK